MIIYRPHRGGLEEAMAEAKEFQTEDEMKQYIYEQHKAFYRSLGRADSPFEISDIEIDREKPCEDRCIGWHDTMYVCVKRYGNEDYIKQYGTPQCIGMCATDCERGRK